MITLPNVKICMNEQEAIAWLLDNYPIPFQCSANYAANTEIGLGTIVNPTPSKVKVGSIIFFADSKVSTVIAVNATSFKCSDQYNNLVDDVAYVVNVAINASGHLITTFSDGQTQDAGLIKQVSSFYINESQRLVVVYNDGSSTDLGPIFNGNINISGNLTVTGGISGNAITGDSIIENMSGYAFEAPASITQPLEMDYVYVGASKTGNKLTFAFCLNIKRTGEVTSYGEAQQVGNIIYIPADVYNKLYPYTTGTAYGDLLAKNFACAINKLYPENKSKQIEFGVAKYGNYSIGFFINQLNELDLNVLYNVRFDVTFLLSDNLAA